MFTKNNNASLSAKAYVPYKYLSAIGVSPDEREIEVSLMGNQIIIRKKGEDTLKSDLQLISILASKLEK